MCDAMEVFRAEKVLLGHVIGIGMSDDDDGLFLYVIFDKYLFAIPKIK